MGRIFKKERAKRNQGGQRLQYSLKEAATQLDVGLSKIKDWIESGRLQAYKIDGVGKNFITHQELERFVEANSDSSRFVDEIYSRNEVA